MFPSLIPILKLQKPYQVFPRQSRISYKLSADKLQLVLLLLQRVPLFLEKTPSAEVQKHVLPFVYTAITNDNSKIQVHLAFFPPLLNNYTSQELCLSIIPSIGKLVDREAMRAQLLPKLLRLVLEGNVLSVSQNCTVMLQIQAKSHSERAYLPTADLSHNLVRVVLNNKIVRCWMGFDQALLSPSLYIVFWRWSCGCNPAPQWPWAPPISSSPPWVSLVHVGKTGGKVSVY